MSYNNRPENSGGDPQHEKAPVNRGARQPVFNLPPVVVGLTALFFGVYYGSELLLSPRQLSYEIALFGFWPFRYQFSLFEQGGWPGSTGSALWSFVSYAFLHANSTHLFLNCLWMAIFGGALARRFGAIRFLVFSAVASVAGAVVYWMFNPYLQAPVIGASAAISGQVGAIIRFGFAIGGPLNKVGLPEHLSYFVPALSLRELVSNSRAMGFVVVWLILNYAFGAGSSIFIGQEAVIAWEAHLGGFLCGLLLFDLFDVGRKFN